jgi:hypothetical protein
MGQLGACSIGRRALPVAAFFAVKSAKDTPVIYTVGMCLSRNEKQGYLEALLLVPHQPKHPGSAQRVHCVGQRGSLAVQMGRLPPTL